MNDNTLYELTVDKTHMNIIIRALSNFMCSNYDGIDNEVVDVPKAMEEIKVASDIQLVLKHQLGKLQHAPKQTSQHTGLVWCKETNLDEQSDMFDQHNDDNLQVNVCYDECSELTEEQVDFLTSRLKCNDEYLQKSDEQRQKELNDSVEYAKYCLDTLLKNQPKSSGNTLTKAWNNVKERHLGTIKQMGDK